jgi:RNA polymerase sigma-70 factor, ECF subfamily
VSPSDDPALILRAQAGDLAAFEHILRALEPALRRYVGRLAGARPVTDVLQETFIRIWRGLGWLRDPNLFRAWAYRIATREAYRLLGRERQRDGFAPTTLNWNSSRRPWPILPPGSIWRTC